MTQVEETEPFLEGREFEYLTLRERSRNEASMLVLGRNFMSNKINEFKTKSNQYEKNCKEFKKPAASLSNKDKAAAHADISTACYEMSKDLEGEWINLQNCLIGTIESFNKIQGSTVIGVQASSLINNWEDEIGIAEEGYRETVKQLISRHEKAKEAALGLGFRVPHENIGNQELVKDIEEKFVKVSKSLEAQGSNYVQKKVGSSILSNKNIVLEDFDGEPENWSTFYDIFKPIVEENSELLEVVKFALLKKACKGKAGDMIKVFTSAENFKEAIDRLKKNYEDKDRRFTMLWDRLEELRPAKDQVASMRKTINEVAAIVAALKRVTDIETLALRQLVKRKFPRKIHEELSRAEDIKTTQDMVDKIEQTINREERIEKDMVSTQNMSKTFITQHENPDRNRSMRYRSRSNSEPRSREQGNIRHWRGNEMRNRDRNRQSSRTPSRPQRGYHAASGGRDRSWSRGRDFRKSPHPNKQSSDCLFCSKDHRSRDCRKVNTIEERTKFFKENRMCFNCGKMDHAANKCSGGACYQCGKNHHNSLCRKNRVRFDSSESSREGRDGRRSYSRESNGYSNRDRSRDSSRERGNYDRSNRYDNNYRDRNRNRNNNSDRSRSSSSERYVGNNRTYRNTYSNSYSRANTVRSKETRLMTVTGRLISEPSKTYPRKRTKEARTLIILDTGADQNYIEEGLAEFLRAKIVEKNKTITLATVGEEKEIQSHKVRVELLTEEGIVRVEAMTIPSITTGFKRTSIDRKEKEYLYKRRIRYEVPRETEAGLLIGVDTFWKLMKNKDYIKLPTGRTLVSTKLGNVICGSIGYVEDEYNRRYLLAKHSKVTISDKEEDKTLEETGEEHSSQKYIGITENPVSPKIEELKYPVYDDEKSKGEYREYTYRLREGLKYGNRTVEVKTKNRENIKRRIEQLIPSEIRPNSDNTSHQVSEQQYILSKEDKEDYQEKKQMHCHQQGMCRSCCPQPQGYHPCMQGPQQHFHPPAPQPYYLYPYTPQQYLPQPYQCFSQLPPQQQYQHYSPPEYNQYDQVNQNRNRSISPPQYNNRPRNSSFGSPPRFPRRSSPVQYRKDRSPTPPREKKCHLCRGPHLARNCWNSTAAIRLIRADLAGLCIICLNKDRHKPEECRFNNPGNKYLCKRGCVGFPPHAISLCVGDRVSPDSESSGSVRNGEGEVEVSARDAATERSTREPEELIKMVDELTMKE
ncbi:hypothetical protein CAEBREN_24447 [Caenorhabditis brenneri]|uniref:CCHC-type domain-containing protein n=1 Tax=Caenorhabditis brenneri TaxID=135651 RepID=G0MKW0_CAEBE|nr:hypothetical protein CAEBREN_24447 [Caenorhabditis brenneri]